MAPVSCGTRPPAGTISDALVDPLERPSGRCGRLAGVGEPFDPIRAACDVDAAWLTSVLHEDGIGAGNRIGSIGARSIGTGQVGENVRFTLTWSEPDPRLPASLVGKFPSESEVSRVSALNLGTYVREVGFYRDLRPRVAIRTPHVHHIGWRPDTHDFVLIMEDIAAATGDQLAGCTEAQAALAIDQAVGLHAPTWGRTEALRSFDWLGFPDPDRAELMNAMMQWAYPGFAERYSGRLRADQLAVGADLVGRYAQWSEHIEAWAARHGGWCVTHGDYRLDNMLFGTASHAPDLVVVDWQTVGVGIGPSDVAYFCGAGLVPDVRAGHERALVERYAAGLRSAGIELSDDNAWSGYVLGSAGGYLMAVLASQLVERTDRGDEMFAIMAERHTHQIVTVGLLDRL